MRGDDRALRLADLVRPGKTDLVPSGTFESRGGEMALDGSILGNCASEQMEALETDYGSDEEVEIGAVITIVQVLKAVEGSDGDFTSTVRMRHNIADPYAALGYLRAAEQTILQQLGSAE
jgi:hypothetical protein